MKRINLLAIQYRIVNTPSLMNLLGVSKNYGVADYQYFMVTHSNHNIFRRNKYNLHLVVREIWTPSYISNVT